MRLSAFDFELPDALVAQQPSATRAASRLLVVGAAADTAPRLDDRRFTDLPDLLSPGDLLVVNDTQVLRARLHGRRETGGRIEITVERIVDPRTALALLRAAHAPRVGARLHVGDGDADGRVAIDVVAVEPAPAGGPPLYRLHFDAPVADVLARLGSLPLPPYIRHRPGPDDDARYQTTFARVPGAVAAPTAGLHFDAPLLARIAARGIEVAPITLHVGAGTFLPVRSDDIAAHRMHAERYDVPAATSAAIVRARAEGRRIVAVGTTSLRALEASGGQPGPGETDLFITPGYGFRVVDRLITNFHLPRSTLLILVSAFAGIATIRAAYAHAIAAAYRFFSYGDAMLLDCSSRAGAPNPGEGPRC